MKHIPRQKLDVLWLKAEKLIKLHRLRLHYHIVTITVISLGQLFFMFEFSKVGLDVESWIATKMTKGLCHWHYKE